MYPMMMPFVRMGADQLAKRAVEDPGMGHSEKLEGTASVENNSFNVIYMYII